MCECLLHDHGKKKQINKTQIREKKVPQKKKEKKEERTLTVGKSERE